MKNKIENVEDLRSEILRIKLQCFQKEAVLQEDVNQILNKFRGPSLLINKLNSWFGNGKDTNRQNEEHDWVTNAFRVGLPLFLNKMLFRQSGFLMKTLVALVSQKAAGSVNKDLVSDWINKGADWIRNFKNAKTQRTKGSDYGIPPDSETY